jgi:type IV pilus assembly protein PilN
MIRINLLAVERERVKRRATFQLAEKVTVACSLILVVTAVFVGWWYWTLSRQSADLDRDIQAAETETLRLRVIIQRVQLAEQHRQQLEQRVSLIEQLRRAQSAPVHLLDEISRNLPDPLWLTSLQQKGSEITLEGRCLQLKAVSDLVANLQSSPYFKRPIDTVTTDTERNEAAQTELVKFTLKVQYAPPGMTAPVTDAAARPSAGPPR